MAVSSVTSSASSLSRWEKIKNAFHEATASKPSKTFLQEHKESLINTRYFLKGAGKSALGLLEAGIKMTPPVMIYEGVKRDGPQIKKLVTNFDGWKTDQQTKFNDDVRKVKEVWNNPAKTLHRLSEGTKDYLTEKTVSALKSSDAQKAEWVGGVAFDVGSFFVGVGEVKAAIKLARAESLINQTSKTLLKGGFYEVNGFKFSKYYYEKLWDTGRGASSLISREVLQGAKIAVPDEVKKGFFRYEFGNWEMIYNPKTKEVWHLMPKN